MRSVYQPPMSRVRIHFFVEGKVQRVFFRETTRKVAESCNVTGWVRNLPDGRVEGVIEGEEEAVKQVEDFIHRGPELAQVTAVSVELEEYRGEFKEFTVIRRERG